LADATDGAFMPRCQVHDDVARDTLEAFIAGEGATEG
jgi:hypothetical protein